MSLRKMSRNIRDKPRRQKSAKSLHQADLNYDSSDDDYAGVDLISDSDEDEPDVEKVEEQAIIDSEEDNEADDESDEDVSATPRPVVDDDQASWAGFDPDDHASLDDALFNNASTPQSDHNLQAADEATIWSALQSADDDDDGSATPRRVRFDLTDSSASFSDNEDNIFPDIFLDQSSLDPSFRRAIENDDNDEDGASSDSGSYWDLHGSDADDTADTPEAQPVKAADSSDEASGTSSGYETDEGETTEEDLPPAAKFVPARSVLRRMSDSSASEEEEVPVVRRRPLRPSQRSVPKLASWVHDASKPFAVIDSRGKRLIVFKARAKRGFTFTTGDTPTPRNPFVEDSDQDMQMSPMISNSANLMMSAMYSATSFDNLLAGQALGPPEAFYPFTSISADGTLTQEGLSSAGEDDVDDEDLWNVEDFLDFGGVEPSSDDDDEQGEGEVSASEAPSSTPLRPSTATSEGQVHPLLSHFESGVVGAFRRNQTRHHLLSRNATTHDGLAFSNPYQHGPIRGIKGGRLEAVNVPITPMRRQKNVFPGLGHNAESPVSAAQKRKFSGETPSHKRTRSVN